MIATIKRTGVWMPIAGVLLTATIAWGAWNTMATAVAVPTSVFQEHIEDAESKRDRIQERIVDKLDEIQQTILDLHKESK